MSSNLNVERAAAIRASVRLSDIVGETVRLVRSGHELKGCCPFHDDSTPSFYVNDEKGVFYCFGCNATGDAITFLRAMERLSFGGALDKLEHGYVPSRPRPPHRA